MNARDMNGEEGYLEDSTTLIIDIEDVNDTPPIFEPFVSILTCFKRLILTVISNFL